MIRCRECGARNAAAAPPENSAAAGTEASSSGFDVTEILDQAAYDDTHLWDQLESLEQPKRDAPAPSISPAPEISSHSCSGCGEELKPDWHCCPHCGATAKPAESHVPARAASHGNAGSADHEHPAVPRPEPKRDAAAELHRPTTDDEDWVVVPCKDGTVVVVDPSSGKQLRVGSGGQAARSVVQSSVVGPWGATPVYAAPIAVVPAPTYIQSPPFAAPALFPPPPTLIPPYYPQPYPNPAARPAPAPVPNPHPSYSTPVRSQPAPARNPASTSQRASSPAPATPAAAAHTRPAEEHNSATHSTATTESRAPTATSTDEPARASSFESEPRPFRPASAWNSPTAKGSSSPRRGGGGRRESQDESDWKPWIKYGSGLAMALTLVFAIKAAFFNAPVHRTVIKPKGGSGATANVAGQSSDSKGAKTVMVRRR